MIGQMLAEVGWLQAILDFFGAVLAWIYDIVGNYGLAIVIFTVFIRIMIIPLGVKQVKSMYAMQRLAPQMKKLRTKYKNDRQKLNEETMRLYRENGVNPMGGCLPLLLQAPVFFALYAVLTSPFPGRDNHIPVDSALYENVIETQNGVDFLGMNLLCTPGQAGDPSVKVPAPQVDETQAVEASEDKTSPSLETLDCGDGPIAKVPYILFLVLMVAMTYLQNAQMMKMNPNAGSTPKVQQNIMKIMPLFFGVIGFGFPAGLIVYWVTSASWQVLQSRLLLQRVHHKMQAQAAALPPIDVDDDEKPAKKKGGAQAQGGAKKGGPKKPPPKGGQKGGQKGASAGKANPAKPAKPEPPKKKGFLERMAEQAEAERERRQQGKPEPKKKKPNGGSSGGR